jgi:hypothetical protein
MIVLPIQNGGRYTQTDNGWVVSAIGDSPNENKGGEIVPIELTKGNTLLIDDFKPLLEVDGIVVHIDEYYLISQQTLNDIKESNNPHWDIQSNGVIKGKEIGKTIPTIRVDVSSLRTSGDKQNKKIANAGVSDVDYVYNTEKEMEVPIGLVKQLNYTLKEEIQRPGDTFSIWNMSLGDETLYSIEKLKIDSAQEDGTLDKAKLNTFLVGINERIQQLRKDFNMIKGVFYNGSIPESKGKIEFTNRVATTEDETNNDGKQIVFKETNLTNTQPQPISTAVDSTTKVIDEKTTTVQKQVEEQKQELAATQQKQTLAQQQLQADLNQQAQRTDDYYKEKYGKK